MYLYDTKNLEKNHRIRASPNYDYAKISAQNNKVYNGIFSITEL